MYIKGFFDITFLPKKTHIIFKQNQHKKMGGGENFGEAVSFCYLVQKKNISSAEAVGELLDLFETHGNSGSFGGCGYLQCSTHSYRDPGVLQASGSCWLGLGWMGETEMTCFLKWSFLKKTEAQKIEKHGGQTADRSR